MRFLAERRQRRQRRERRERRERIIPRNLATPPRPRRRAWGNGLLEYWSIAKLPLLLICIFVTGCPGPKFNPPPSVSPSPTPTATLIPTPTPTPLPEAI